jgi:hypothetical protein
VTAKIAKIAQGWERLSGKAKGTTLASSRLRDLAKQAGCEGYISRGDERLKESLDYDGDKTKTARPPVRPSVVIYEKFDESLFSRWKSGFEVCV